LHDALPISALKGKAERYICLPGAAAGGGTSAAPSGQLAFGSGLPEEIRAYVQRYGPVKLTALQERFPGQDGRIKEALAGGELAETVTVKNRLSVKRVLTVFPPDDRAAAAAAAASCPPRLAKQRGALLHMLERTEPIGLQRLLAEAGLSASSVRALADKGLLRIEEVEEDRDPYAGRGFERTKPLPLTELQAAAFARIAKAVEAE